MDKSTQGKKSRSKGKAFELKVRADLEKDGWIISKWCNNVSEPFEQDIGEYIRKLIPAKAQYNPFFKRIVGEGSGFPDFIVYRKCEMVSVCNEKSYHIFGVECKSGAGLDKKEKDKCRWLLENKIFCKIWIATKGEKRGQIVYTEFKNEN
jgi:hypothetical protein